MKASKANKPGAGRAALFSGMLLTAAALFAYRGIELVAALMNAARLT